MTSAHLPSDVRIFEKECACLARNGYSVTLIAPGEADACRDGIHVVAVPRPHTRWQRMTRTAWRVFVQAARQNAHVYHFHDPELMLAGLLLRAGGKKVVCDIHEDFPKQVMQKTWLPRFVRHIVSFSYRNLERFAARCFSGIATADGCVAARLSSFNSCTVALSNYPLLEEFSVGADAEPARYASGRLVSFGGVSPRTCTAALVRALGNLPNGLAASLLIGGRIASDEVMEEVSALPGWARVHFRGTLSRKEMIYELHHAAVAIVLYSPEPNNMSVRSNRLFESMASGLPVIASDIGEWRDIVHSLECGLTVDPTCPDAIADAIQYLIRHPDDSARMGRRGREHVLKNLNWATQEPKLLRLYEHALRPLRRSSCRDVELQQ